MGKDLKGRELGVGISQRQDDRYEARYTDRYGKRKSIYGTKISEVKRLLHDIKYERTWFIFKKSRFNCG